MQNYTRDDAINELCELEANLLEKTDKLLKAKNYDGVAGLLILLDNEIYETEREARRLRLEGSLDVHVYKTLMDGYHNLSEKIAERASKYGLLDQVKNVYTFHRYQVLQQRRSE
ncbi:MAG: hypothetical protein H3Z52_13900 [archaeon]|nr:hypothetical protein [archaeon]